MRKNFNFLSCIFMCLLIGTPLLLQAAGVKVGMLDMPYEGNISSAIYEENGQLVRIIGEVVPQKVGKFEVIWDGKDSYGNVMPNGNYQWRAISSQVKAYDDGQVGQGAIATPATQLLVHSNSVFGLAFDGADNFYTASFWEEHHNDLRKWDAQWVPVWGKNNFGGITIAVDKRYVYCARELYGGKENRIERFEAETGNLINWTGAPDGFLLVNEGGNGVFGLAVDKKRLWVSNFTKQRVEIYDVDSGVFLSSFPVTNPLGITLDDAGNCWVCNSTDRVTQYSPAGIKGKEITGLQQPYAIDIGGPKKYLYVAEVATGRVLEYDSVALTRQRALFGAATPGPIFDNRFRWPTIGHCGIAVDSAGRIACQDAGNHRVQLFDNAGKLLKTIYSEFQPAPSVDPTIDPNALLSTVMQYTIDYTPGKNYGHWYPSHNWMPADGKLYSNSSIRRRLANGKDYIFFLTVANGMAVYQLLNNGMRLSTIIGRDEHGLYNWSDTDGDGKIDPEEKSATPGESGYWLGGPGCWVDNKGNFWLANWGESTVRVDCEKFDAQGNPVYNWQNRQTIMPVDKSRWKFSPKNLRVDPVTGEIFRLGTIEQNRNIGGFWMSGTAVERCSADGKRISIAPLPAFPAGNISDINVVIATDSDGHFFYVGHDNSSGPQWVNMYTTDALLVAIAACGAPNNFFGGWMDHGMGLTAFTHPNGSHYAYSEDVYYGKSIRFRYDNVNTIKRFGANFRWNSAEKQTVTVTSSTAPWGESEAIPATFTVARNSIYGPLTVRYAITGKLSGEDYSISPELTGTVIIPDSQQQMTFSLKSIDDQLRENPDETIIFSLMPSDEYSFGEKSQAELTQLDDDVTVQVVASTLETKEGDEKPAIWTISRDDAAGDLTVHYTLSQPPVKIVKVSASSYYQGYDYLPEHSIDGKIDTIWQSFGNSEAEGKDDAPFILFQFDRVYSLDYLEIVNLISPETGRALQDVDVLFSLDGEKYQSAGIKRLSSGYNNANQATWQYIGLAGVEAAYVKLMIKTNWAGKKFGQGLSFDGKNANPSIVGLSEIRFFQPGAHPDDFQPTDSTVKIPDGATSATVTLKPQDDALAEKSEGVSLTILADQRYKTGKMNNAQITILDNEPTLPEVTMSIENSTVSEKEAKPAIVTFTRSTTVGDLTVKYSTAYTKAVITVAGTSSDYPGGFAPSNSYDGDFGSYWQSFGNAEMAGHDDAPYITYTFDRIYRINTMKIANLFGEKHVDPRRSINEVEILVSTDGTNFSSLGVKKLSGGTWSLADAHLQSLELGGVAASRVMLKIKSNYFPTQFGIGKSFEGQWANSSIAGLSEIAFFEGGTASSDDYLEKLTGTIVIPDGKSSITITITPKPDEKVEQAETLQLSIDADTAYLLGEPVSGKIDFLAD